MLSWKAYPRLFIVICNRVDKFSHCQIFLFLFPQCYVNISNSVIEYRLSGIIFCCFFVSVWVTVRLCALKQLFISSVSISTPQHVGVDSIHTNMTFLLLSPCRSLSLTCRHNVFYITVRFH